MFYVHDVFFSRIVGEMAIDLTPVDFLFGTEPAVYVCGDRDMVNAPPRRVPQV